MAGENKNNRILDIYEQLCEGKSINKEAAARQYGVSSRSIQRDIDDIRCFLAEKSVSNNTGDRKVEYDQSQRAFFMTGLEKELMSNGEILAVSKILLESRAFTKKEMDAILDKLIAGCVPLRNMKLISELLSNEKYHFVELHHKSSVKDKLWELGEDIRDRELLEIVYGKQVPEKETVTRIIEPVSILFSEYYFYLNAYIVGKEGEQYRHLYDYPAIFRVDRIHSFKKTGEKFHIVYRDRFQEGEFRKRVQFMFAGELTKVQFKYQGTSIDSILDRLPTAKILSEKENEYLIEAEVFGKGIVMWLLSQGASVEIIKPVALRLEMKKMLTEMLQKYD